MVAHRTTLAAGVIALALASGTACASAQPVLYTNDHLATVGSAQAGRDIAECRQLAEENVGSDKATDVATRAGEDAVVGGATGAVIGGIIRGPSGGRGAAAGAAAGAVRTVAREAIHWNDPQPIVMAWVNRCLFERGYDVIGWD